MVEASSYGCIGLSSSSSSTDRASGEIVGVISVIFQLEYTPTNELIGWLVYSAGRSAGSAPIGFSYQATSQYRPNLRPCSVKWATRLKPNRSWSAMDAGFGRAIPA